MRILLIDNYTSYLEDLKKELACHEPKHEIAVLGFDVVDLTNIDSFDAIILSGGHKYTVKNILRNIQAS